MTMRIGCGSRGFSLVEGMVASSIATLLGGVMLVLFTGIATTYNAQITLNELAGYLDVTVEQLKRDIWRATTASAQTGDGICANGNAWLTLANPTSPPNTVRYCFDASNAQNIRLQRTEDGANLRNVAQYIVPGPGPNTTTSTVTGVAVNFNLVVRKAVFGRQFTRSVTNASYRLQTP